MAFAFEVVMSATPAGAVGALQTEGVEFVGNGALAAFYRGYIHHDSGRT